MKTKTLAAIAMCGLVLSSCGSTSFKDVKLDKNATANDSIAYLFGEQNASQKVQLMAQDTTLKSEDAQKKFDEGFKAGIAALKDADVAYLYGFMSGSNAIATLKMQGKELGEDFSADALVSGYTNAFDPKKPGTLKKEISDNASLNQGLLMSLMQNLQQKATKKAADEAVKQAEAAKKQLPAIAKKEGYNAVNGVYVKTVNAGNEALTDGQQISVNISLEEQGGKVIFPPMQSNQTVGQAATYSPAVDKVMSTFKMGGHYRLLGSASDLFPADMVAELVRAKQIDPSKLYVFDYEILGEAANTPAAPAAGAAPATVE